MKTTKDFKSIQITDLYNIILFHILVQEDLRVILVIILIASISIFIAVAAFDFKKNKLYFLKKKQHY